MARFKEIGSMASCSNLLLNLEDLHTRELVRLRTILDIPSPALRRPRPLNRAYPASPRSEDVADLLRSHKTQHVVQNHIKPP